MSRLNDPKNAGWHALDASAVLTTLRSDSDGLTTAAAQSRLAEYGPNLLRRQSKDGPLVLIWRQINNPLIWVLIVAAAVAVALGKVTDGLVVLAVVILNTIIGFVQEFRAGQAIEALSAMVPENVTVRRDGRRVSLPVAELVPGDIVLLAAGEKVPADLRVITVKGLRVDEAALTGESVPVEKQIRPVAEDTGLGDRTCMVFGGTLITYGTATAVVAATGNATELGRISAMLRETTNLDTPLTKTLAEISAALTVGIVVVASVLLAGGAWRLISNGVPLGTALTDTVIFAIALAVGAIPEGLPAIVTIALAIGVQRMAARRAIIRKLPAAETLGSTTIICSDKTGTLTRNQMTVQEVWTDAGATVVTGVGYAPEGWFERGARLDGVPDDVRRLLLDAALCSEASLHTAGGDWHVSGDPTEAALVVAAEKAGVQVESARVEYPRRDVIPFESENQFMASLHSMSEGPARLILKGAPEAVLRRCSGASSTPEFVAQVDAELNRLADRGMRVLAVADKEWTGANTTVEMSDTASGFRFSGLVGMIDPARPEAIAAVETCRQAGITVKMITGDHPGTAQAIGRQLGLIGEHNAISGHELSLMDDAQLRATALAANVFARVAPEHKLRLVRALQQADEVVAMTGDGVNDAPALKQANIGIAMGITGTSVAKQASDIVLADDNFASIAAAVEEGRRVYDNLIKSLVFVLPTNLGLAFILIYAVIFFPIDPATKTLLLPVQPTQLLWINLVAAVMLALPLAFEAKEPNIMQRPPRRPDEPVLGRFALYRTTLVAVLMTAGAIVLFQWEHDDGLRVGLDAATALAEAQTIAVTTVIMFQVFYLLNCRSLKSSLFKLGFFSNPTLFVGIFGILLLQAAFIYLPPMNAIFGTRPLPPADLLTSTLVGAIILPVISAEKWWRSRSTGG